MRPRATWPHTYRRPHVCLTGACRAGVQADVDGSGALSLNEFHKCIREAELGLTRKEINRLMQEVDADQARRGHGSSEGHRSNG